MTGPRRGIVGWLWRACVRGWRSLLHGSPGSTRSERRTEACRPVSVQGIVWSVRGEMALPESATRPEAPPEVAQDERERWRKFVAAHHVPSPAIIQSTGAVIQSVVTRADDPSPPVLVELRPVQKSIARKTS